MSSYLSFPAFIRMLDKSRSMFWLNLFIVFVMIPFTKSSENICISQTSCKCVLNSSAVIDFSSVGKVNSVPLFFDVSLKEACNFSELYSYNPCYEFDLSGDHSVVDKFQKPCSKAAACVKIPGGPEGNLPEEHAIGLQSTAVFGKEPNESIYINYTVPGTNRQLKVFLTCDNAEKPMLTIVKPECEGNDIVLNFTSKCACPNGCPTKGPHSSDENSGLSTGSILLISFFTIFLAYMIVGVLWNLFNGAQGLELIPNFEFWNELPVLIMEGITFTTSCFGRTTTYSEV